MTSKSDRVELVWLTVIARSQKAGPRHWELEINRGNTQMLDGRFEKGVKARQ